MTFETFLSYPGDKILIEITRTRGSTPREAGTFMLVSRDGLWGTVGGGHMEFDAIDAARGMLAKGRRDALLDITLGPDTGQCCGGRVELSLKWADQATIAALRTRLAEQVEDYPDVYLYGAGHVGRALALALKPLPLNVTIIEVRAEELAQLQVDVPHRLEAMPEATIRDIRPGGAAVILTHDHALDFLIGAEALKRDDLAYIGMIGSKTKRAVFASWLRDAGLDRSLVDRLVLPIGGTAVRDKRPAVIAALVAAELLAALLGGRSGQAAATTLHGRPLSGD
jgi:xanthine dehydrogenase accessory factor